MAHLGLTDFRNYEDLDLDFAPGVNVLLGSNGQGKTNIVEAVAYLATFTSHRVANDTALVRAGAQRAVIRSSVTNDERTISLDVQINPGRANRVQVNRTGLRRIRDALGVVRAVMFAPEDLSLVKGDPAARRRFLDALLIQRTPRYAAVMADYDKTLKQRNSLLRSAAKATSSERAALHGTLEVWNDRLVEFGADLQAGRTALVAALREPIAAAYATVAPVRNVTDVAYQPARITGAVATVAEYADALRASLAEVRAEEVARAVTVIGPHRDELDLRLNDLPARGYASHGESWSLALALRLASYEVLRDEAAGEPVLILDDVFAELDDTRRRRLAEVTAQSPGQVLITAAVPGDVPNTVSGVTFSVEDHTVRKGFG